MTRALNLWQRLGLWLAKDAREEPPKVPGNQHAFALGEAFPTPRTEQDSGWLVWQRFRECATIADDCQLGPMAWCTGTPAQIRLGTRTICRGILLCDSGLGKIEIGELVYVGDDVIISTRQSILIGARTLIAHGVQIFDNDSHPVGAKERHEDYLALLAGRPRPHEIASAPVEIGEDCWIGVNSILLKGVRVGSRSIVAAGSVVTSDVPEDCLVAGNPARIVRSMTSTL